MLEAATPKYDMGWGVASRAIGKAILLSRGNWKCVTLERANKAPLVARRWRGWLHKPNPMQWLRTSDFTYGQADLILSPNIAFDFRW